MAIFNRSDFDTGAWAAPLARVLRERNIIPDRHPKARLYRRTWSHWIQVEPTGFIFALSYDTPNSWHVTPNYIYLELRSTANEASRAV